ncbi:hypothetical protein JOB18_048960, partial [Solea senegalensis]
MASVDEFLKAPSEELLDHCSREQLLRIAEHFQLEVGDKRMKENIKNIVKANLVDFGIFKAETHVDVPVARSSGCNDGGLTFEQRKELLLLQTEMEKLALEKLRSEAEIKRLHLEESRLSLQSGGVSHTSGFAG